MKNKKQNKNKTKTKNKKTKTKKNKNVGCKRDSMERPLVNIYIYKYIYI